MESDLGLIIFTCILILMIFLFVGFTIIVLCNPCHPWVHNIRNGNYCGTCGEQLNTICECGEEVTGSNYCNNCGLAVIGGYC